MYTDLERIQINIKKKKKSVIYEEDGDYPEVMKTDNIWGEMVCNTMYQKLKELSGPKIVS